MVNVRFGLVLSLAAAAIATIGCSGAPSASPGATPTPAAGSPTATPPRPTTTVVSTPASPTPSPSAAPTSPAGRIAPAGYAQSCARDIPWGVQVTKPFICLEGPVAGTHVTGGASIIVSGYAGGSFESNVVTEVRALIDREPGVRLASVASTYSAPDVGMPGAWRVTLSIPASAPVGAARVIAHFDNPRDGSVVAQAMVDIVID